MNFWLEFFFRRRARFIFFDGESTKIRLLPCLPRRPSWFQRTASLQGKGKGGEIGRRRGGERGKGEKGQRGRERGRGGKGREEGGTGKGEGRGEFASLALGGIDAPASPEEGGNVFRSVYLSVFLFVCPFVRWITQEVLNWFWLIFLEA